VKTRPLKAAFLHAIPVPSGAATFRSRNASAKGIFSLAADLAFPPGMNP
jgi:hypothetical protein